MRPSRLTLAAGALALLAAPACNDVPVLPKWDAEWYVPLPSQSIALGGADRFPIGVPIPPGTSASVSFPVQSLALDQAIGRILRQPLSDGRAIVTIATPFALDGADTLFVAADSTALTNPAAARIVVPFTLVASQSSITDTVEITQGLSVLSTAAQNDASLYVQVRGRVTYSGTASQTVTAADSIGVKLALFTRIGVSTR
ncbi:MAG: hypothetical protein A2083_05640 [Gemmatimonadetes bacterium GWC2_71_9]|nr:MAG: hypothetical protein A2083_05640 [Gemmatimonadetes bacterium GWC2_71_9]